MENRRFRHLVCDILVLYLVSWEGSKCRNVGAFETKREPHSRTHLEKKIQKPKHAQTQSI